MSEHPSAVRGLNNWIRHEQTQVAADPQLRKHLLYIRANYGSICSVWVWWTEYCLHDCGRLLL